MAGTEQKKLHLLDALLNHRDLLSLLNAAAEILGNPVFVADRGLNVIAQSGNENSSVTRWPEYFDWRNTAVFDDAFYAGDFQRVYSSDNPVIGVYPNSPDRMLAARIRNGQEVIGHVVALECYKSFDDEDSVLIVAICQALSIVLASRGDPRIQTERYHSLFLDLLEKELTREDVEFRLELARVSLPGSMQLLIARPSYGSFRISAYYLREQLLRGFPGSMGIIHGDELIHLVKAVGTATVMEETIRSSVFMDGIKVGVSRHFEDPLEMSAHYLQADRALELSNPKYDEGVLFYENVLPRHLADCAARVCDPAVFRDPGLERLERYDRDHGTNHATDLFTYLDCGRSVSRAAERLSLHRNSMYYRVTQAAKIAELSLEDEHACFLMQLAIAMHPVDSHDKTDS